jgi:hypothetical protein
LVLFALSDKMASQSGRKVNAAFSIFAERYKPPDQKVNRDEQGCFSKGIKILSNPRPPKYRGGPLYGSRPLLRKDYGAHALVE